MRLLFETQEAAREVAFMLRCKYDGCTMITLPLLYGAAALTTAIEPTGANFCFEGDHHPLVLPSSDSYLTQLNIQQRSDRISRKAELWHEALF
jgi:hypothetical protein